MDHSKKSSTNPSVITTPTDPTTSSHLFPDLNLVHTPEAILRNSLVIRQHEKHLKHENIFTETEFLAVLHLYAGFDILTYSVHPYSLFWSRPIRKLIYGVGQAPLGTKQSICLTHTHAKLWICYNIKPDCPPDVYLGSANATNMIILDLMIKVNSDQAKVLIEYFILLWNANYKKP